MSRRAARGIAAILAALAITALGLTGAYAYGNNYNIHRGFNEVAQEKGAGRGQLMTERFYSPAMHKEVNYLVYLPPGYSPTQRYPVYYLLHGEPSRPQVFVQVAGMTTRLDNLMFHHESRPMILVFPNGQIDNNYFSDSEWANTPSGNFETYVIEVVHHVDQTFSTIPSRNARVIAGFSMGGYGAMNIGLHHLNVFGDIQAWSGYYVETHNGVFAHATPQTMYDNSPGQYITRLRGAIHRFPLNVFMYVGNHDSDAPQQPYMADALREAGAHVADRLYLGGHDWHIWWPHIDSMIELASYDVHHPPRRTALIDTRIVPVPARFGFVAPATRRHHHRVVHHTPRRSGERRIVRQIVVTRRTPGGGQYKQLITVSTPAPRSRHPTLRLIGALLLALVASALINLGFVLQHRGHASSRRSGGRLRDVFTNPSWLLGQLVGWAGWAGQIVAVALVPLTLVQAVGAGSLALSVPLAAWLFEYRVTRGQILAIGVIALSLASLPVGAGVHGALSDGLLIGIALLLSLASAISCLSRATAVRATAAGVLYGVADAAVKADAISLHNSGIAGLVSGWTVVAALATLGGFLAFQAALRGGRDAVQPLSLMAALSAVTGVVIGVAAFREPLGSDVATGAVHLAAIALVLLCVPVLVRAQQRFVEEEPLAHDGATPGPAPASGRLAPRRPAMGAASVGLAALGKRLSWQLPRRIAVATVTQLGALIMTVVCAVAGVGLLYSLRGLHALGVGPSIRDSLPLLQLAGFDGQPLLRVLVAFIAAGLALGVLLRRLSPTSRMLVAAPVAALLLLVASDASYALSNNIGFFPVLAQRGPPLGPWLEWLLLVASAALPGLREASRRADDHGSVRRPVEAMPA